MSESEPDRINDVVLGVLGDQELQAIKRRRVDWLTSRTRGPRVLDVGCSGGIVSVLCARAGHHVIGADVRTDAVETAEALRAAEPQPVRERLQFRVADFTRPIDWTERFDTILAGELIEHIREPRPLLANLHKLLVPGGQLLLTTPFGAMPHPDHHHLFMLSSFVALVRPLFGLETLDVTVPYILFEGSKTEHVEPSWLASGSAERLLATTEGAYLALQEEARERRARYHRVDLLLDALSSPRQMARMPAMVLQRLARSVRKRLSE